VAGDRDGGVRREAVRTTAVRIARRLPWTLPLLNRLARAVAGRHRVGALAVVVDTGGHVLLVRHALRSSSWALPGGWVGRNEDPADTVVRELHEELSIAVRVVAPVACESHGKRRGRVMPVPSGLTVAYLCWAVDDGVQPAVRCSAELLEARWVDPAVARTLLSPFDARALAEALRRCAAPDVSAVDRRHRRR
jgi:8-oxo-dGTP diphosphatase